VLLALEAGADDLLAGDPNLSALRRLLYRLRALSCSVDLCGTEEEGSGLIGSLCARCRRCGARRGIAGRSSLENLVAWEEIEAEEETDEEDENHRLMAAAHYCPHPRRCPGTLLISDLLVMLYCFDISYEASCLLYLNVQ